MAVGTTFKLSYDGQSVQRGLMNVGKSFVSVGMNLTRNLVAPLAQMSAYLAPAALVGGMVAFGKSASDAAATIENMKGQFDLFTGSAEGTAKLIKELRKIAVESPLELSDISEGARMLLTYGVEAEKTAGIINQLSEVSAGSSERFQRISYAFGQIWSVGRLMGTELRQLTEAGFNPLEFISKKTGESMMDLKKRMEDGGIAVSEVEEALKAATSEGGRFYGMNAKMAQTFTGRVSMMKDAWSQLLQGFGEGMNNGLKVAVDAITTNIPQFYAAFKKIGEYFGSAIADSVRGNNDKFLTIGDFIGTAIGVGMKAAFFKASTEMVEQFQKTAKDMPWWMKAVNLPATFASMLPQYTAPSTGEFLEAGAINAGLSEKGRALMQGNQGLVPGNPGWRYAGEGESSVFTDASGNRIIKVMEKVEQNTRTAKM